MATTSVTAEAFADVTADKKERIREEHERALTVAARELRDAPHDGADAAVVDAIVAARLAGMSAVHAAETLERTLDRQLCDRLSSLAERSLADVPG
jgi:hypothetical protein